MTLSRTLIVSQSTITSTKIILRDFLLFMSEVIWLVIQSYRDIWTSGVMNSNAVFTFSHVINSVFIRGYTSDSKFSLLLALADRWCQQNKNFTNQMSPRHICGSGRNKRWFFLSVLSARLVDKPLSYWYQVVGTHEVASTDDNKQTSEKRSNSDLYASISIPNESVDTFLNHKNECGCYRWKFQIMP